VFTGYDMCLQEWIYFLRERISVIISEDIRTTGDDFCAYRRYLCLYQRTSVLTGDDFCAYRTFVLTGEDICAYIR
jgi:hypothetical protein